MSSLWKKASCDGACTFYLTILKMEGFDRFSLCFWHISTKANSFLARRLTLTSLVFFFPETKLSPCFHITAFKFLYFPVFAGNVTKIYGPRKSAPRNYFSCAGSGGLFSESKTGPRWDWVANHNAHGHYNDNTLKKRDWFIWNIAKVQSVCSILVPNLKPCIHNVDRFVISYSQFDSRPVFFFIFRRIQAKLPEISETRFAITPGAIEINSPGHRQFFLYYFLQMISLENTKTNRFGRERIWTIPFLASFIVKVML